MGDKKHIFSCFKFMYSILFVLPKSPALMVLKYGDPITFVFAIKNGNFLCRASIGNYGILKFYNTRMYKINRLVNSSTNRHIKCFHSDLLKSEWIYSIYT